MVKITFMGAGSTVFARNVLGDCLCSEHLRESHIALYDIDAKRLRESKKVISTLNRNINRNRAKITAHHGVKERRAALRGADFVVNAIQVGGYEPATVDDFEIPKRYGLRQTIADTLGIGGIFRALRTIPVLQDFARDIEKVCPEAWFLNYTNPMSMLTGFMQRYTNVKTVGLCHSVQVCARVILHNAGLSPDEIADLNWQVAGINHMGWLLSIKDGDKDLYPMLRRKINPVLNKVLKVGAEKFRQRENLTEQERRVAHDAVRLEMMRKFGYYVTESSEHNAEYAPYWIKSSRPEMIAKYGIPLDEYPRRCVAQIRRWKEDAKKLVGNSKLKHNRSGEYGSRIMDAIVTDQPFVFGGNVINNGVIKNLPENACVEVACTAARDGVSPHYVGALPEQCAALNRTNINVHLMAIEAAATLRKEALYQAAFFDPHTAGELTLDEIVSLCDDLLKAHGKLLPKFK